MSATVIRLSIVVAFVVASVGAGKYDHLFTVDPSKDSRCHGPSIDKCFDGSLYPVSGYKLVAWFFHPPFKSCRPLYTPGGVRNCTFNNDLPTTREECEDICGESCTRSDGSVGICTLDEYCKNNADKATANPRPCVAYGVKCCPRRSSSVIKSATESEPVVTNNIHNGPRRLAKHPVFHQHRQQLRQAQQ